MAFDSPEDMLLPRRSPVPTGSTAGGRHRDSSARGPVADTRLRGLIVIVSSSLLGIGALAAAQAATGITIASTDAVAAPVLRAAAPVLGIDTSADERAAEARRKAAAEKAAKEKAAKVAAEKAAKEKAAKAAAAKAAQEKAAAERARAAQAAEAAKAKAAADQAAAAKAAQERAAAEAAAAKARAEAAQQQAAAKAAQAAAEQQAAQAAAQQRAAQAAAQQAQQQAAAQQAAAARAQQQAAAAAAAAVNASRPPSISSFSCTRRGNRMDARVTFSTGNNASTIRFNLGGEPVVRAVAANANTASAYMIGLPSTTGPCSVTISNGKGSVSRSG